MALFTPFIHGECQVKTLKVVRRKLKEKWNLAFGTGKGKLSMLASGIEECNKIGFGDKNARGNEIK